MFQIRGPTWRTTAPGDGCLILQTEMVMAMGYTKPRVVPDSSLKWRSKCTLGKQSLEKEAELGDLAFVLTPSPHPSLCNYFCCQRAQGNAAGALRKPGDMSHNFSGPGSGAQCWCWLTWCHVKGGKDRWVTQKACDCLRSHALPWAGPLPTRSAPSRVFCLVPPECFPAWSFLRDKSSTSYL